MKIFVFGSNRQGRHGAGAALAAWKFYGAINGQAEGLQGQSYAIITKELRSSKEPVDLLEIQAGVMIFTQFAKDHPELDFFVTALGTNLAGFEVYQIAPLFDEAKDLPNVQLCQEFKEYLQ